MPATEPPPSWSLPPDGIQEDVAAPVVRPGHSARSLGFEVGVPGSAEPASEQTTAAAAKPPERDAAVSRSPKQSHSNRSGPPLAKRPKGRLFVGSVLIGTALFIGGQIWQTWFRYQCYGVVRGRVIQLSAPWNGIIRYLHKDDGELVQQGELLVTMESPELSQRLGRVGDELRLAQATLNSQLAQLQWDARLRADEHRKALAEYCALWGQVLQEQAQLLSLQQKRERHNALLGTGAIAKETLEETRWSELEQRKKVAKLMAALDEMKQRAKPADVDEQQAVKQLQPHLMALETLSADLRRIRSSMDRGHLRAPVNGQLIERQRQAGEFAAAATPVMQILEEGSIEIVLYVPQSQADRFPIGRLLHVEVEPLPSTLKCRVTRLDMVIFSAPKGIQRHYRREQSLVPVHLELSAR